MNVTPITNEERAEWETAVRDMIRDTVLAHLLGHLQPALSPMFKTLDRIDRDLAEIARTV